MFIHAKRYYSVADPKPEYNISKLVHSKTTKMVTILFILHPCHLLCTPTSLTLSCPLRREDGCLHTASPAGNWGRRAATKAVLDPQITSFTASIMVDKIPSGKLLPYNGIRPVEKGERKEKQKGQIMWVTWLTKSPESAPGELQKYCGTW